MNFIILERNFMSGKGTLTLLSFHAFKQVYYVFMLYIRFTLLNRFFKLAKMHLSFEIQPIFSVSLDLIIIFFEEL